MFKLNRVTCIGGDETAGYDVILDKEYSVSDFIKTVVGIKSEWGYISVKNNGRCEYKWGDFLSNLDIKLLDKKIKKVSASGGWSRMDYEIEI